MDGGVTGNNNPVLAGLIEAVASGAAAPGDVRLLSIGTATVVLPMAPPNSPPTPFTVQRPAPSVTGDLHKLATAILDDPPDSASFIAHVLTGQGTGIAAPAISHVVRMNPLVTPVVSQGELAAPDGWSPAQFQYLCNLDIDAIEQNQVEYINAWCQLWLQDRVPNQPLRMDGTTRVVEVGYGRFSQAFAAWAELFPRAAARSMV